MFLLRLFLSSLSFATIVASEIATRATHIDPGHEALPAQDGAHAKSGDTDIKAIDDDPGLAKPSHADSKAIDDEDAESSTAIEVAFHDSEVDPKMLEQPKIVTEGAAEMIVQPSGEVLAVKLDKAPETPVQNKQRSATKARRVAGEEHRSLHAAPSPVLRADTTPTASADVVDGAVAGVTATLGGSSGVESPVLRTDATPKASPAAAKSAQWSYNTQQNKWVKVEEDVIPAQSLNLLQRNLSRWKQIFTQVDPSRAIFIALIVVSMIVAVWFSAGSSSATSVEAMSTKAKDIQKPSTCPSRLEFGLDDSTDDTDDQSVSVVAQDPKAALKAVDQNAVWKKVDQNLIAALRSAIEDIDAIVPTESTSPASPGEECANVQMID